MFQTSHPVTGSGFHDREGELRQLGAFVEAVRAGSPRWLAIIGTYAIDDPVFALWVRWRRPGGSVVPMTIVGDDAEREVPIQLANLGFELVYQSRASRGAFDLLAIRGARQLAIQVKRSALPLAFKVTEWQRMSADAKRLGWRWTIAAVEPGGAIRFLDPAAARRGKQIRLGEAAAIDNLVLWLDRADRPR